MSVVHTCYSLETALVVALRVRVYVTYRLVSPQMLESYYTYPSIFVAQSTASLYSYRSTLLMSADTIMF